MTGTVKKRRTNGNSIGKSGGRFELEFRQDSVGYWLIATAQDGEQRALSVLSNSAADLQSVADLRKFGVKG